jgi:Tol biopolymer transport system component
MLKLVKLIPNKVGITLYIIAIGFFLSACGGEKASELVYTVNGSAPQAQISYRDQDGATQETTASLPWEVSLKISGEFEFALEASNTGETGTVSCSVAIDGRQAGSADGKRIAGCEGKFKSSGDSASTSFQGRNDVLANGESAIPTPPPAATAEAEPETPSSLGAGQIAFASNRDDPASQKLYLMNADGSGLTSLTAGAGSQPTWLPNGAFIAFTGYVNNQAQLFMLNLDTGELSRLTNNASRDQYASISFTTGQIALTSNQDGDDEIYVLSPDGSSFQLTSNTVEDTDPDWSRDGLLVAYSSQQTGNADIYIVAADGSVRNNLTNHPAQDGAPAWSPDTAFIAFASDRDGDLEIYVIDVLAAVNGNAEVLQLTDNETGDAYPAWSPDGTRIAFMSNRDGNFEIYVMNADGSGQVNLTNDPGDDWFPAWRP